jgi:hypothetical protein
LLTFSNHLREVLTTLLARCAPARDERIHKLIQSLDTASPNLLGTIIVDTSKAIFELADTMKDDLAKFIFGAMSEEQLGTFVSQQAREQEIAVIIELWGSELAKAEWISWLKNMEPMDDSSIDHGTGARTKLSRRLLQVLQSTSPALCSLPSGPLTIGVSPVKHEMGNNQASANITSNLLPGLFLFVAPTIYELQNRLQALVIAACLHSLATAYRIGGMHSVLRTQDNGFMARIWALLESEISTSQNVHSEGLRLMNLADELVSRLRATANIEETKPGVNNRLNEDSEKRLRSAVDRTLRAQDPVFILLQKRLFDTLRDQMCQPSSCEAAIPQPSAPERLRSGRAHRSRSNGAPYPLIRTDSQSSTTPRPREVPIIRGFEDLIIRKAVNETFDRLIQVREWILQLLDTEKWQSAHY